MIAIILMYVGIVMGVLGGALVASGEWLGGVGLAAVGLGFILSGWNRAGRR